MSVFWHTRDAKEMVERYKARVWAPRRGRPAIERRAGVVTDAFGPDDALPGGVEALRTARAAEVVYWIPEHEALVPGDVLLGDANGGIRLCPASWLPESVDQGKLAESLRPLLDLPVERVLLSHGEPGARERQGGGRRRPRREVGSARGALALDPHRRPRRPRGRRHHGATTASSGCATRSTRAGRTSTSSSSAEPT